MSMWFNFCNIVLMEIVVTANSVSSEGDGLSIVILIVSSMTNPVISNLENYDSNLHTW